MSILYPSIYSIPEMKEVFFGFLNFYDPQKERICFCCVFVSQTCECGCGHMSLLSFTLLMLCWMFCNEQERVPYERQPKGNQYDACQQDWMPQNAVNHYIRSTPRYPNADNNERNIGGQFSNPISCFFIRP